MSDRQYALHIVYILEIKFDIYSNSETFNFLQTQQTF